MSDLARSSFDLTYGCGRSVETCRRRSEHVVVSVFNQPAAHVAMTVGVRAWLIEGRRPPEDGPIQPASPSIMRVRRLVMSSVRCNASTICAQSTICGVSSHSLAFNAVRRTDDGVRHLVHCPTRYRLPCGFLRLGPRSTVDTSRRATDNCTSSHR